MLEWLLSFMKKMTGEEKREWLKASLGPEQEKYKDMWGAEGAPMLVDGAIKDLDDMLHEEPLDDRRLRHRTMYYEDHATTFIDKTALYISDLGGENKDYQMIIANDVHAIAFTMVAICEELKKMNRPHVTGIMKEKEV